MAGLWQRFSDFLGGGVDAMSGLIDRIASRLSGDPEDRKHMAFSVAIVALSAKMAKADGVVTFDEVDSFRRLVSYPENQAKHVERLFELARRDVAGFESYASKIGALYEPHDPMLVDIMDALFEIAGADTLVHDAEIAYLARVAEFVRPRRCRVRAHQAPPHRPRGRRPLRHSRARPIDEL